MMEIVRLRDVPPEKRDEAGDVLVECFLPQLSLICKEEARWKRAFRGALDAGRFWVAVEEDTIVGIAACSDGHARSVGADPKQVRAALGQVRGFLAMRVLRQELQAPLRYPEGTGYIECVATRVGARGKGIAGRILKQMMREAEYKEYILEVVDTNARAMRVYERLGFHEYDRKKAPNPRQMGFNARIYMKKVAAVD